MLIFLERKYSEFINLAEFVQITNIIIILLLMWFDVIVQLKTMYEVIWVIYIIILLWIYLQTYCKMICPVEHSDNMLRLD